MLGIRYAGNDDSIRVPLDNPKTAKHPRVGGQAIVIPTPAVASAELDYQR